MKVKERILMAKTPHEPICWFIIPCYNEGSSNNNCILETAPQFIATLRKLIDERDINSKSRILYVDDGSTDDTWHLIKELSHSYPEISGVKLTHNKGHQYALLAGLMEAKDACDITITLDCDNQDDIGAAQKMIRAYKDGYDVVYGVRSTRQSDTTFKRVTALAFYKLINAMGAETIYNHADYRLMSARVIDALSHYHESNLFLRGLIPSIGFPHTKVSYVRSERKAGESRYPLTKMIELAISGITSFSTKPLHIIAALGLIFSFIGLIGVIWAIITSCMGMAHVAGWASTVCIVCIIGGIQLLCLGVIGEYVGKIYMETKARPRYIIEERTNLSKDN